MLKPEDAPDSKESVNKEAARKKFEDYIDGRLMAGVSYITPPRDACPREVREAVLQDYRDLGWVVIGNGPWEFRKPYKPNYT
jgi:hypothetical protein